MDGHVLLFDLDNTLYPPSSGVMDQIRARMLRYICQRLNLGRAEADVLRRNYFEVYGTTMRGLQINHGIDPDDFLPFVHDIPLADYLQPNPVLDAILAGLPQPKVIFTNASRDHAERVLTVLGIRHHFERIVDVRDVNFESKPQPPAYRRICQILDVSPKQCIFIEDNVLNLLPAKALGMTTVLVQQDGGNPPSGVDYVLPRIEDIQSCPPIQVGV